MGLNEGVNVFVDEEGKPHNPFYVPAYVRRYPYLLARLDPTPRSCRSASIPSSDLVGEFDDGEALFDGGQPSETLDQASSSSASSSSSPAQRTAAFVKELTGAWTC